MYCKKCGRLLKEDDNYCPKCGSPIDRFLFPDQKNSLKETKKPSKVNDKRMNKESRKKKSGIFVWLFAVIAVCLVIAGLSRQEKERVYTYIDLTESQKADIDFILSKSSVWESEKCDSVGFTKSEGKNLLSVFYLDDMWQENYYEGTHVWYRYDSSKGEFYKFDSQYEYHSLKIYNTENGRLRHTKEWSEKWSDDKKKEYLSDKLYRYANSK